MEKANYVSILKQAIKERGNQYHLDLLQEEASELITAISHYRRDRISKDQVIEELADVIIVSDAVRLILDDDIGFYDIIDNKMERLKHNMEFK